MSANLKRAPHDGNGDRDSKRIKESNIEVEEGQIVTEGEDDSLATILGFSSFGTTKNTHVKDNSTTAARGGRAPKQTRKARQYLNLKKKQPETTESVGDQAS